MTNVIQLRGGRAPVGQFIRIGTTGHRQVEDLIAEGRFPVERVVLDASALHKQKDLGETLRARGTELVLDTNASELSEIGRFEGAVRHAPWAHGSRPLGSGDFEGQRLREIVGSIATLAIDAGFSAVLAPAHLLRDGSADSWFPIDSNACIELRSALDRLGGRRIAIDYPLMIPYALLRDTKHRSAIVARLANLPIENLWVRTSSFGADATAAGVRRYIEALTGLFDLGLPIVADGIAGLVGFSTLAFGGAAAIAHGIGEHERFDTSDWNKKRIPTDGWGPPKRVWVPALDRHVTHAQMRALVAGPGGRAVLVCQDRGCCRRGLDDMLGNAKAHYIHQNKKRLDALSAVPELSRAIHFVTRDMRDVERSAHKLLNVKVGDQSLMDLLAKESRRLERIPPVLEDMLDSGFGKIRSTMLRSRANGARSSEARG